MRTPQASNSRIRPSVPQNPNSFSTLRQAQPSLPRHPGTNPTRLEYELPTSPAPARLGFNLALPPSIDKKHLCLTSRRSRWHCASPGIGHCGFRLTRATRPRSQVCQGQKMGPESPSPGAPKTVVASVNSLPQPPLSSLGSEWPAHLE